VVRLAGQRVAFPASAVESVIEIESLVPVPGAAPHIAGLTALRSRVLTVIDGRSALGRGSEPKRNAIGDAVVVSADGHPYAIAVDEVEDVIDAGSESRPASEAVDAAWRRVAPNLVEAAGEMLLLICADALIAGPGDPKPEARVA